VLAGTLTLGSVLLFIAYLGMLQEQMKAFVGLWASVHNLSANVDRIAEILEAPCEVVESPDARAIGCASGALRFENVSFGYDPERAVLVDINLDIPAGSTVAVVGSSGAGKSTLAALVPRFFDPQQGSIRLDGVDLRNITLKSLRKQVAVVLQEAFLFPMTVAQNIAYGDPDASREQIVAAAVAAGADPFIRALPQGYDTPMGERGASLSGGERQRISIARALLKNAPVLILDEPTASLDAATEAGLLEALQTLMRGRTTLVIAHRLSTIRNADSIVVLDRGSIAEVGSHQQLIERDGIYADLHTKQHGRRPVAVVSET
jgi:ATP-binding cassette subfamily B protein/subfamily B ATP-binding cassette protein MsbA